MKRSKFSDSQILAVLKQSEAGTAVPDLCREHGISSATFYKWRAKFVGMDVSLVTRMKELDEGNRRLKKLYVEAQIKADIVAEACNHPLISCSGVMFPAETAHEYREGRRDQALGGASEVSSRS